jgi:hypothetical protein
MLRYLFYLTSISQLSSELVHAVTLLTSILEVPGSGLCRDIDYLYWFAQVPLAKCRIVTQSGNESFLPNRFQFIIHQKSYNSKLTESLSKETSQSTDEVF